MCVVGCMFTSACEFYGMRSLVQLAWIGKRVRRAISSASTSLAWAYSTDDRLLSQKVVKLLGGVHQAAWWKRVVKLLDDPWNGNKLVEQLGLGPLARGLPSDMMGASSFRACSIVKLLGG